MSLDVQQFLRKEFPVDAVQVTAENMEEVAAWATAQIHDAEPDDILGTCYIQVRVQNPLSPRQTRAYVGDWVLYASKGYKVYTDKGFRRSFYPKQGDNRSVTIATTAKPGPNITKGPNATPPNNVFDGGSVGGGGVRTIHPTGSGNPGGTSHV